MTPPPDMPAKSLAGRTRWSLKNGKAVNYPPPGELPVNMRILDKTAAEADAGHAEEKVAVSQE